MHHYFQLGKVLSIPFPAVMKNLIVVARALVIVRAVCQVVSRAAWSVPVNYPVDDSDFNWVQAFNSLIELCKYHVNRNKLQ